MADDFIPEKTYGEGRQWLASGQVEQACETFCRLLDVCPGALNDVAAAFARDRLRRRAVAALQNRAESQGNLTPTGWVLAARLARDLGQPADALRWAEQAAKADPACADWWLELGEARRESGDRNGAASAYRRCLSLDRDNMFARTGLALCTRRRGSWIARLLSGMRWTKALLRRIAWSGGRLSLLEAAGHSPAAHQMRYVNALEQGAVLPLLPLISSDVEPGDLSKSMEEKPPPFWRWFQALGIENEIRKVLDVGCGTGFAAQRFLQRGYEVTGLTCNEYEKRQCVRRGLEVIERDLHFLSLPDDSFDLLFSSHSLEHGISPLFALWEWKRVIRPGGYLLIIVPLPIEQDPRIVLPSFFDEATDTFDIPRPGEREPTAEELSAEHSAYGIGGHTLVLNLRQMTNLVRVAGLDLAAVTVENPASGEVLDIEKCADVLSGNLKEPLNGMYLLQKPRGEARQSR